MSVPFWAWAATVVALLAVLGADLLIVGRKPHAIGVGEAGRWVVFYIGLAAAFGVGLALLAGPRWSAAFVAGYITEYSLSVDNLFVFLLIMTAFKVPKIYQHRALLVGITIALVLRSGFIALGAAVLSRFSWVFYLFGLFLVLTAIKIVFFGEDDEYHENGVLRFVRRMLPMTKDYDGPHVTVRRAGKLMITPMLMVMITIGVTDLMFALDSIPAIFGLTSHAYIVFTATVFALMGLRQLYFLLGGLIRSLVYLSHGLALILAFIGVKLVLEALHGNALPFVNDGQRVPVPTIGIELSLAVVVGILIVTTLASLIKVQYDRRMARAATPARTTIPHGKRRASMTTTATSAGAPAVPGGDHRAADDRPTRPGRAPSRWDDDQRRSA